MKHSPQVGAFGVIEALQKLCYAMNIKFASVILSCICAANAAPDERGFYEVL